MLPEDASFAYLIKRKKEAFVYDLKILLCLYYVSATSKTRTMNFVCFNSVV